MTKFKLGLVFLLCITNSPLIASRATQVKNSECPVVIWKKPRNISTLNLYYGPGSPARMPVAPFEFLEEDKHGISPKFQVRDARGMKWSVKLGAEAQAETVATRLVWAMGYLVEETYYFPRIQVRNLPRLSSGQEFVERGGYVRGARFEARRAEVKRGDDWHWRKNPFAGSRELDGLRTLMILLNNHDTKNSNNRILLVKDTRGQCEAHYVVSDLGATLGRAGGFGGSKSKNDLAGYRKSEFIEGIDEGEVDFDYNVRPTGLGWIAIFYPPAFLKQWNKGTAMKDIPVAHAYWIGTQLVQLTDEQLHDAFRAAAYDRATATGFVSVIKDRIRQLIQLRDKQRHLAQSRLRSK
jgi:hypothetical protein